jgi:transposase-like protein
MAKSVLNQPFFHDEEAAFAKLESIVWRDGIACPKCGVIGRARALEGVKDKKGRVRPGLKKCYACRSQFTVRVGTVFEDSKVPLHLWFQAVYLLCSSKKGISSNQLHRTLGVTLKTAWFMSHRIREAMRDGFLPPLGGIGKTVEADETYIGTKKGPRTNKRGWDHKHKVLALVERGGKARSFHVDMIDRATVRDVLARHADRRSVLNTDEAGVYKRAGKEFTRHASVNHSKDEYVRYSWRRAANDSVAHTNTIEGYFSIFKRGMRGVYQHCSEDHLFRYLAEFDFRYNNRVALGVNDADRTVAALAGITGKRLKYRD